MSLNIVFFLIGTYTSVCVSLAVRPCRKSVPWSSWRCGTVSTAGITSVFYSSSSQSTLRNRYVRFRPIFFPSCLTIRGMSNFWDWVHRGINIKVKWVANGAIFRSTPSNPSGSLILWQSGETDKVTGRRWLKVLIELEELKIQEIWSLVFFVISRTSLAPQVPIAYIMLPIWPSKL